MEHTASIEITEMQDIRNKIRLMGASHQQDEIKKSSPYSNDITQHIRMYSELQLYYSLHLQESNITRPALIKDIDFDLWVSSENCTNLELLKKGNAPFAFDSPEGKIELHHIGQDYASPFAELTIEEHQRNSQLLHFSRADSWRSDPEFEKAFFKERSAYWRKRAQQDYIVSNIEFVQLQAQHYQAQQEYLAELRETCEEIYRQCTVEDLDYLSDLAKSYSMMQRMGASTMREFLQNSRDAFQTDIKCYACNSSDYVLFGTYYSQGERIQRYKCKACGKVFTPTNKSLVSGSSFSYRDWIKFIDCLYNGYTLKQISKACDISEKTAHDNRTRLFYALKLLNDKVQLQGNVVIDETYLPVSFKGNHSKQENFVMPRAAYKRGGENHEKGLGDNLVCIVCALDDSGNSVAKVSGTGNTTAGKLQYVLKEHLSQEIFCIYLDKSPVIKSFAESCGYEIKQEKLLRKGTKRATGVKFSRETFVINRQLQRINSYHSRLKKFLSRSSGISTKYLSGYLYLFAWKERNKEREPAEVYKELLMVLTEPNNYVSVEDITKKGYLPDAVEISSNYRKHKYIPTDRDRAIYDKFASGQSMTSIAAEYSMTKQNISLIIQKFRDNGFAYKTVKDIEKERPNNIPPRKVISKSALRRLLRDYQIYKAKQSWTGTAAEFEHSMSEQFGLSAQSIKNIVSRMKRVIRLKEEMFIYEEVSYRSQEEVYRSVYADFLILEQEQPNLSMNAYAVQLAEKHGFSPSNITRIIDIMGAENLTNYFEKKHRLTSEETYYRDKALYIDYLRWDGTPKGFYSFASRKYKLSHFYVQAIIQACLFADPSRYEMR